MHDFKKSSLKINSNLFPKPDFRTAFGMLMPERAYNKAGYRFGYNGKEMDNEVSAQGNQYDYGFRIYNPRLGWFLSIDPLFKGFPWFSPYQFAGNSPIFSLDLDGLEIMNAYYNYDDKGNKLALKNPKNADVAKRIDAQIAAFQKDDQALYDYLNKFPVIITDGNLPKKNSGDQVGECNTKADAKTSLRQLSAREAYDKKNGEGSFMDFYKNNEDAAVKYNEDYKVNPENEQLGTEVRFSATITLDLKKIERINNDAMSSSSIAISSTLSDGQVLKHEAAHFLYSTKFGFDNKGNAIPDPNDKNEQEAKRIEKTFDGNPKTQTDVENYSPPR